MIASPSNRSAFEVSIFGADEIEGRGWIVVWVMKLPKCENVCSDEIDTKCPKA
jgi:hypothetical protein